jgi:hypothetical protein
MGEMGTAHTPDWSSSVVAGRSASDPVRGAAMRPSTDNRQRHTRARSHHPKGKENGMGYIDGHLGDGEQVVFRTKRHAAVIVFPILALAISVTVFGFGGVGFLVVLLAAAWLAVELANHGVSEFGVTNQRVLMKQGYLPRRIMERPLEQCEGMQVAQSPLGKKLGYGTIIVRGTDGSSHAFSTLNSPAAFQERVQEQLGRLAPAGAGPAQ